MIRTETNFKHKIYCKFHYLKYENNQKRSVMFYDIMLWFKTV